MTTTYGALFRKKGATGFFITAEPQVKTRLKRVFPRISQAAADEIAISDTAEHCRDLLWFMDRYPLKVCAADRRALEAGADNHRDRERRLADLLAGIAQVDEVKLAKPPRHYQLVGAQACEIRGGLLLADDVGVGKTVTGILPMAKPEYVPAVFVAETHLTRQMEGKLKEFLPARSVHRIRSGQPYELQIDSPRRGLSRIRLPDVIVISYHMLRGWAETLGAFARYAVFDECQRLRSHTSDIYQACAHLARKVKMSMGLSATPIYNYGNEFFWVVDAMMPGVLGSRVEFVREWCDGGHQKARLLDGDAFGAYLRREGIMLRRSRKDVGREIPKCQIIPQTVDCDASAIDAISGDAAKLARVILANNEQYKGQRMQASSELDTIYRQATGVAKAPYVAEFVRLLIESGEKVLLFGWHREVYKIWQERLAEYNPAMFTGSESPAQKADAFRRFQGTNLSGFAKESQVMFMSLRAGAGVDGIQKVCRTAVIGELDWSDGVHTQCIGRIARDGQEHPTVAYVLVADHGSDPIVADVCGIKHEQREDVINPGADLIERVDIGENHIRRIARQLLELRLETYGP